MLLKRVTITGFKSFANKTVLDLESGITGIVGPNGSGKSNLADAIRWALGEQSKGRLRLSDREEVIFAGTDKRARASYAEVVLLFDNDDGVFPLELAEIEIGRRLYRSGEADYRLAGRSVRLADIQSLLTQAGFGAGTYAVIGQGMIDSFLLSSPAERKLLFDEAAGIRGPEQGRDAALRKLEHTATNLTRLQDIAAELAPRLASLQQAVSTAAEQSELEQRVAELRTAILAAGWARHRRQQTDSAARLRSGDTALHRLRHERRALERQSAAIAAQIAAQSAERQRLQQSVAALEQEWDRAGQSLAEARTAAAQAEHSTKQAAALAKQAVEAESALAAARHRRQELETELAANTQAAERALQAVDRASREVARSQEALIALRRGAGDGTRDQYVDHALQILKTLALELRSPELPLEQIRLLVHKAGRLLSHASRTGAAELLEQLKTAQKQLETAMTKRETAVEHQTNITITGRSLEIDLQHQQAALKRAEDQLRAIQAEQAAAAAIAADRRGAAAMVRQAAGTQARLAAQLDDQRSSLRQLSPSVSQSAITAEIAAGLERTATTTATTTAEQAQLRHMQTVAAADLVKLRQRAEQWGLKLPVAGPAPRQSLDELETQLVHAEAQLAAQISIRRSQADEFQAADARQAELTTQIADLQAAKADLEHVIAELDVRIRERFKTNFQALAEQFSAYFTRLFGSGQASLELTTTPDGSYGVDIKASPAGKRLTSITALSGGERALAGVALLAAILRVNPSPFVVLDEIDAALDEANSGRLADILTELQEHSQLIIITHNRQTMRAARVLFGVTSSAHHVSHLLSMRLEQATALAAR